MALKPALRTEITTHEAPRLSADLRQELTQRCEVDQRLAQEIKELEQRRKDLKGEMLLLVEEHGDPKDLERGLDLGDYTVKEVRGTMRTLNKRRLMAITGCTPDQLEDAYDTRAKAPYLRIDRAKEIPE